VEGRVTDVDTERSRVATRDQILDAADEFLAEHPFRDLTVSVLMTKTSVSRPAFYQYFHGRYDIAEGLIERIQQTVAESGQRWVVGEGGVENCDAAMRHLAKTLAPHGYAWKAIADASCADHHVEELWRRGFLQGFMNFGAQFIQREQAAGAISVRLDAELTAEALVLSVDGMVVECLSDPETAESMADAVGEVLSRLWCATLYGDVPKS
jgi:AcrR family transcriptional regulator